MLLAPLSQTRLWTVRLLRGVGFLVFLAGFVAFDCCMLEHEYAIAVATLAGCLVLGPLITLDTWRRQVVGVVVMLFVFLGLLTGTAIYFAMFYLDWFRSVFNHKGSGEAGWMLFVSAFAVGGGFVGYGLTRLVGRWFGPGLRSRQGREGTGGGSNP